MSRYSFYVLVVLSMLFGALFAQDKTKSNSALSRFDRFDRDKDGKITTAESRGARWFNSLLRRYDKNKDGVLQRSEMVSPNRVREADQPAPRSVKGTAWDFTFKRDFRGGMKDSSDRIMHATNVMDMAVHDGKLWAGLSYRGDEPLDERAATIIVKESSKSPWKISKSFGPEYTRVGTIENITFTTDRFGKPLSPPVEVLMASDWKTTPPRTIGAWSYNDHTKTWHRAVVHPNFCGNPEIRRFVSHIDKVTGVHLVFGLGNGTIYTGAYDSKEPGLIKWLGRDSLSSPLHRCLSGASVGGDLYVQFAIRVDDPEPLSTDGGLFRRIDGPQARWEHVEIEEWLDPKNPKLTTRLGAMRAMVPLPSGDPLFSWKEPNYTIERLVPKDDFRPVTEVNVYDLLNAFWGGRPKPHMIVGYNEMYSVTHPATGEQVHLIGLFARPPGGEGTRQGNSSWFLVRHADNNYSVGQVIDPEDPAIDGEIGLRETRSIVQSPFPDERDNTFYFAGFDEVNFRVRGEHGWIYKATLPDVTNTQSSTNPTCAPNEVRDAEYYYPLMWAPCYFNKNGKRSNDDICLRRLDPKTGGFVPVTDYRNSPHCIVLAEDVGPKGAQGPELARCKDGFILFFNRRIDGKHEVWRTKPFGLNPDKEKIDIVPFVSHPSKPATQIMHSRGHNLDRVGVLISAGRGTQYGFMDEVEGNVAALNDLPFRKRGDKARWLPDRYEFTFVGEIEQGNLQIVVVDAETHQHRVISNPANPRNYETATPFRASEYPGEVLIAATAEKEIVIFRDMGNKYWKEIKILTSPDPELRYLDGVEIIERDAVGAPGVGSFPLNSAIITAWATNSLEKQQRTHSGIFLWSLDGKVRQRIDTGKEPGKARYDPELVVLPDPTTSKPRVFVHFISRDINSRLIQVYVSEPKLD